MPHVGRPPRRTHRREPQHRPSATGPLPPRGRPHLPLRSRPVPVRLARRRHPLGRRTARRHRPDHRTAHRPA
ncbi:hypothetical protein OG580_34185 [Streptomyces sp. NBC_00094]|nr:hypothetical protein [Streptomyces sp. NBC_00094]MCX5395028.1 hypothetical protein [Streptomyces sp. NBC_00094]